VKLTAPAHMPTGIMFLPDPQLGDVVRPDSRIQVLRSMTGLVRTHVKRQTTKQTHVYNFNLAREKALELQAFIQTYAGVKWRVTWGSQDFVGILTANPAELEMSKRAVISASFENVVVSLEFETE